MGLVLADDIFKDSVLERLAATRNTCIVDRRIHLSPELIQISMRFLVLRLQRFNF